MIHVEYLITVKKREALCISSNAFLSLVQAIDGVSMRQNQLQFKAKGFRFDLQMGDAADSNELFFHLKLFLDDEASLPEFLSLLRLIRNLLHKISESYPQTLWDGVSFHYGSKAYPFIHEIENLLRKLITKFMIVNIGLGWAGSSTPKEVVDSLRTKEPNNGNDYLYNVDFIQLSNFLFREYAASDLSAYSREIKSAKSIQDLDIEILKSFIPASNWDKYFSSLVDCEGDFLANRWSKLYEKRNLIAHCRPFSATDYESVVSLCDELRPVFTAAIDNLDKIAITEADRDQVSEQVPFNTDSVSGLFVIKFSQLINELRTVLIDSNLDDGIRYKNVREVIESSRKFHMISPQQYAMLMNWSHSRNLIIHQPGTEFPIVQLNSWLKDIESLMYAIRHKSTISGIGGQSDSIRISSSEEQN